MKLGLQVPQWGELATRGPLIEVAQAGEEAGLASLWVSDHLVYPLEAKSNYPYTEDGQFPLYDMPFLEIFAALGLLAGVTNRVALGTSILVMPMRETVVVAKQLATVAFLAPERLIVGVGAGWLREEFELLGRTYENRGRMLNEQIEAVRGLLGTENFSYKGELIEFPTLVLEPRPPVVPPFWIGGNGKPSINRAGRLGDAWHPVLLGDPKELADGHERVRAIAAEAGRPDDVELTTRIGAEALAGGAERLVAELDSLREIGCSHVLVDPEYSTLDGALRFCAELGELAGRYETS